MGQDNKYVYYIIMDKIIEQLKEKLNKQYLEKSKNKVFKIILIKMGERKFYAIKKGNDELELN